MKKFTAIDIAQDLINRQSMELENGKICYYLHIGEDGNLTDAYYNAEYTLCVERTPSDYGLADYDAWTPYDDCNSADYDWTCDDIYAHESLDDPIFAGIVQDFIDQLGEIAKEEDEDEGAGESMR